MRGRTFIFKKVSGENNIFRKIFACRTQKINIYNTQSS